MEKFFDYFDQRHRETSLKKSGAEEGPVITISRLTGCDARQVAENVVESLNRKSGTAKWKWVDKDIIYDIAKELNTNTERVENFYKGIELSNMSEMIMAFSGGFVSDLRVKKAIKDVVLSICKDGHVVLVGRGGVSIAHDISRFTSCKAYCSILLEGGKSDEEESRWISKKPRSISLTLTKRDTIL